MSTFRSENWKIELLPEWVGEVDEDCSTIYHPDGVGALQISAFVKDSEVTEEDLKGFAKDHIEAGARLSPLNAEGFKGFTFAFGVENEFWQFWYVSAGNVALFITYNCEANDRDYEVEDIRTMVASVSAT